MPGKENAQLKQMLLAAQSSGKHVVAGEPQAASSHTTGIILHYCCCLLHWLTKCLMHMNNQVKQMGKILHQRLN